MRVGDNFIIYTIKVNDLNTVKKFVNIPYFNDLNDNVGFKGGYLLIRLNSGDTSLFFNKFKKYGLLFLILKALEDKNVVKFIQNNTISNYKVDENLVKKLLVHRDYSMIFGKFKRKGEIVFLTPTTHNFLGRYSYHKTSIIFKTVKYNPDKVLHMVNLVNNGKAKLEELIHLLKKQMYYQNFHVHVNYKNHEITGLIDEDTSNSLATLTLNSLTKSVRLDDFVMQNPLLFGKALKLKTIVHNELNKFKIIVDFGDGAVLKEYHHANTITHSTRVTHVEYLPILRDFLMDEQLKKYGVGNTLLTMSTLLSRLFVRGNFITHFHRVDSINKYLNGTGMKFNIINYKFKEDTLPLFIQVSTNKLIDKRYNKVYTNVNSKVLMINTPLLNIISHKLLKAGKNLIITEREAKFASADMGKDVMSAVSEAGCKYTPHNDYTTYYTSESLDNVVRAISDAVKGKGDTKQVVMLKLNNLVTVLDKSFKPVLFITNNKDTRIHVKNL